MKLAARMETVKASDIREILKVTQKPDIISFAGGLPAPELFPAEQIGKTAEEVLRTSGAQALQYSTTEGYPPLRKIIAERMNDLWRTQLSPDDILIVTGSQQALDLTGKLFLDEGDAVICESPTYLGAIMAFNVQCPRWVEIPCDDDGMDMQKLEEALRTQSRVKFIYVVPNFQNPSGRTWSEERRRRLVELSARYDVPIIEDNPYGELCFEETIPLALQHMDKDGRVIGLGTLSKIFCPGLRLGWVAATRAYLDKYNVLKQAADLHSSTFDQMVAAAYLQNADLNSDILQKREVYRRRRDVMIHALEREMPNGVRFTRPKGGLFLWLELPENIDSRTLLQRCLSCGVAFVPGEGFFPRNPRRNTMRLNFSNMPDERIDKGITRLANTLKEMMKERPVQTMITA